MPDLVLNFDCVAFSPLGWTVIRPGERKAEITLIFFSSLLLIHRMIIEVVIRRLNHFKIVTFVFLCRSKRRVIPAEQKYTVFIHA